MEAFLLYLPGVCFFEDLTPEEASHVWTINTTIYQLAGSLRAVAAFAQTRPALPAAYVHSWSLKSWVDVWRACVAALTWEGSFVCSCFAGETEGQVGLHCTCRERMHRMYGEFVLQAVWAHAIEVTIGDADEEEDEEEWFSVRAESVALYVDHAFAIAYTGSSEEFLFRRATDSDEAHDSPLEDIQLMYILAMTGDIGVSGNGDSWMAVSALCGVSDGSFALVVAFYELEDGKNQQGQATMGG